MITAVFAGLPMATLAAASPRTVTVAIRTLAPFVIENDAGKSGFTIELWEEIAKRQGWTTQYVEAKNVTEQLKDVAERRADVGAGAISITADRRQKFDFSQPIFNGGLQILVPHRAVVPSQPGLINFLPLLFSKAMAMWLFAGLILSVIPAHIFWLIERRKSGAAKAGEDAGEEGEGEEGDEEEEEEGISRSYFPGIFQAFAWSVGFLGFMPDTFPHRALGRLLGILWGFIAIIFVSYFTATLTTNLTVNTYAGQITGPSDLPGKKVATVAGTTSERHLQDMGIPAKGLPTIDDCYRGLREGSYDAVVFDSPVLRYYAAGDGAGAVELAGPVFHEEDYGFAFPTSSELRPQVDQTLLSIRQDGTYDLIKRKWFGGDDAQSGGEPS
ncbi:MAG: transporter substrate-binding domain-containing protein [Mycobacterium sp.]